MMNTMVETFTTSDRRTVITSLGGIDWWEAPGPPKDHTCWIQTEAWIGLTLVLRCACGAISDNGTYWTERNSREAPTPEPEEEEMPRSLKVTLWSTVVWALALAAIPCTVIFIA